jgi:Protein of unknown function (DUF917)
VNIEKLGTEEVDPLLRGASLLGAGGGGNPHLSALWLGQELASGAEVRVVGVDALDQGWVLVLCAFGSGVSVAIEKLPAGDELRRCVATAEHQLGCAVDAIGVLEIGGSNALFPFIAAAQTGKPVVDGDLMVCVPKTTSAQVTQHVDTRAEFRRDGRGDVSQGVRSGQVRGVVAGLAEVTPQRVTGGFGGGCEVGPRRGSGLSTGPFPRTASRTRRATLTAMPNSA